MSNNDLNPPEWVKDAVFYQIFPDRFNNGCSANDPKNTENWGQQPKSDSFYGGDLRGIIDKLDYLEELGINALYLNPIFSAPSNHKYDTTDYYTIDSSFGNKEILQELVDRLHRRDMKIILDGVFNHCGRQFFAFQDVLEEQAGSRYSHWFKIRDFPLVSDPEPNYVCWGGVPRMPEFNLHAAEPRQYLLDVARHWVKEVDIDGWRLDTVHYLPHEFVRKIRAAVKKVKTTAYVMGEVMGPATSWFKSGCVDGVMNYQLWELMVSFFADRDFSAGEFDQRVYFIRRSYPLWANKANYNLISSHDKPRFFTLCEGDLNRLKLAIFFQFTFPGVPAIYYGDEVGLKGGPDPLCRKTFPWDRVSGGKRSSLFGFYQKMINNRQKLPALQNGSIVQANVTPSTSLYGHFRSDDTQTVLAILNNSSTDQRGVVCNSPGFDQRASLERLLGDGSCRWEDSDLVVELPADGYGLWEIV